MTSLVRELRIVYSPVTLAGPLPEVGRPADAAALLRERLEGEPVEVSLVHPRDVFKSAILANAAGVIVTHNHPSGDPTPSPDDVALCVRLRAAAALIGIELLDFVIIGDGRYYSFQEMGR